MTNLTLADVLTADELAAQTFEADTPLTGWWMPEPIAAAFERMGHTERRHFVLAAIEATVRIPWSPLQDTLTVLLMMNYAPPRIGNAG